jgi:hypothetical protein
MLEEPFLFCFVLFCFVVDLSLEWALLLLFVAKICSALAYFFSATWYWYQYDVTGPSTLWCDALLEFHKSKIDILYEITIHLHSMDVNWNGYFTSTSLKKNCRLMVVTESLAQAQRVNLI